MCLWEGAIFFGVVKGRVQNFYKVQGAEFFLGSKRGAELFPTPLAQFPL